MLGTLQTSAATCSSEVGERVCCSMPRQSGQICSPRPADAAAGVPPLCEAAVAARRRTSSASMYTPTSRTPEKRSTQRWQTSLRNRVCATRELKSSVATAVRSDCSITRPGRRQIIRGEHLCTLVGRAHEHVPRVRACACLPPPQYFLWRASRTLRALLAALGYPARCDSSQLLASTSGLASTASTRPPPPPWRQAP